MLQERTTREGKSKKEEGKSKDKKRRGLHPSLTKAVLSSIGLKAEARP
jgi:hypothetical protein